MTPPGEGAPHADVVAEVTQAAARAEQEGAVPAAFLAQARGAAARLAAVDVAPDDIRGALALLEGQVNINVEAPATSHRRSVVLAKRGFRRAARWYLRHLALQVSAMGEAVLRVEKSVAGRLETAERRIDDLVDLRERVERLEGAARQGPPPPPGLPGSVPPDGPGR
ncbi:MAG: hypothetical protein ABIS21_05655 [Acidimicrobiales bacterium]